MKPWSNILLILGAFGAGFIVALLVTGRMQPLREQNSSPYEQRNASRGAEDVLAPPVIEEQQKLSESASLYTDSATEPMKAGPTLEELFLTAGDGSNVHLDQEQVEQSLRDHIARNHPRLHLSDSDYERLSELLLAFRGAGAETQSLDRTTANSDAIKSAVEDREQAADEFENIVGLPLGEFLRGEDAPVRFGSDRQDPDDDEIVTEYLSDYKP